MIGEICGAFVALLFLIFLIPRFWKSRKLAPSTPGTNPVVNVPADASPSAGAPIPFAKTAKPRKAAQRNKKSGKKKRSG